MGMVIELIYTWNEVNQKFGYPLKVREALTQGKLYKVGRGYYSEKPHINPFLIIAEKYPYAIATMDTAFYMYGLTDVIPDKTHLATMRNATRINDESIVQTFLSERVFSPGKSSLDYDGVTVTIYDRERMLVEALRNSKAMPFDYYKEIISGYRNISYKLDYQKIDDYISVFKKNEYLYNMLRREVL